MLPRALISPGQLYKILQISRIGNCSMRELDFFCMENTTCAPVTAKEKDGYGLLEVKVSQVIVISKTF